MKPRVDDEEEEVPIKRRGPYGTKKCGVYHHGHTQDARLKEEQLIQTKQFRKSHMPPRDMLRFFREQNVNYAVSAQKLYNVLAKMKKKMQGHNMVEEVLCLSAQWSYTTFSRNCDGSNVLIDIVVAHPTSIQMMRT
ncbi:hypothetical protein M9H77_03241 [Catharanthus roseus]|uniref:Uncharacterized protein n=1 Tax=Catharanthus roseus TaxID=4058 RepID=A0ACC0CAK1_CATRO|nr:hypothetical protein M9H77_03241 [Catharanthus roseus]